MRTIITNGKLILPDMMTEEQELVLEAVAFRQFVRLVTLTVRMRFWWMRQVLTLCPGLSTFTLI